MNWTKVDDYHIKSGEYTITKPGRPELYALPYGLYRGQVCLGFYADVKQAINMAREDNGKD